MPYFKAFGMIYLHYENKATNDKKQENNFNYINLLKHIYEYHAEKLEYRNVTYLIFKVLPL